ncbi:MAG: tRNA pseudouridine(55) synthase TruB [Pseudomonadota bacterium]
MTNNALQGLIVVNKPPGITSYGVVGRIKKILQVRKAGHTGTLDPFATGVLPVCLNEGTKLASFIVEGEKEYEGVLLLGVETDTQDVTGRIVGEKRSITVTETEIKEAFQQLQGKIMQKPPMYSALKYHGTPLYLWARQGKEVDRKEREVEIYELSILTIELPLVFFRVVCSKGTYIRTLVSSIGKNLGCGACLERLTRTRSGDFFLNNAITLAALEKTPLEEIKKKWVIPPTKALSSFPAVTVDEGIVWKVRRGNTVTYGDLEGKVVLPHDSRKKIRIVNPQGEMIAVAEMGDAGAGNLEKHLEKPAWKLIRVFNLEP